MTDFKITGSVQLCGLACDYAAKKHTLANIFEEHERLKIGSFVNVLRGTSQTKGQN